MSSYHVTSSFSKNVLILRSCLTKWLRNICRFPNWSFRINLKNISSSHISIDKLAFSFFKIFVDFSLKPVYPTMVGDKFQIDGVQITGKCICESKIEYRQFSHTQVLIITPQVEENYSYHPPPDSFF